VALFRSILCAVDFSEHSARALQASLALARIEQASLVVMTVVDPLLMQAAAVAYELDSVARQARSDLAAFVAPALDGQTPPGDSVVTHVATGKPAREILRAAESWRADLIVMGTHGLGGLKKLFFGSTTERVLQDAGVAVLAVPASEPPASIERGRPVLLAVALDRPAAALANRAAQLANDLGSELVIAHALEPLQLPPRLRGSEPEAESRREHARQQLDAVVNGVQPTHGARAMLVSGDVETAMHDAVRAAGAGLLVVGLGRPESVENRPGTSAYRLVCASPVPVLALNEGEP
jgi:nucleotide-binding universal stress UspA family protein